MEMSLAHRLPLIYFEGTDTTTAPGTSPLDRAVCPDEECSADVSGV